jgi:hypothetical protein
MTKLTVKKLDIMSVAKIQAVIGAIIGFFIGLLAAVASSFVGTVAGSAMGMGFAALGIAAIIVVPIFYGIASFIGGAIGAFIYNIVAERIGGIKFET